MTSAHRLGQGGTLTPSTPTSIVPDGLLPQEIAKFEDLSGWTLGSSWTSTGTSVQKAASAGSDFVTRDISIPAGNVWVSYTLGGATAGFAGMQLQGPFANYPFVNRVTANHVARFSSPAHTRMRMLGSNAFDGAVENLQVVPMDDLLAQPSDIYIMAGQSLMAAEQKSLPVDPAKDYWVPRCLYWPGVQNNTYGARVDEVAACTAPLQMVQASQGVSPAVSFAQEVEKSTAAGRTVLIIACANGGSRLVGPDAEWNPAGTGGTGAQLYDLMRDRTLAALAEKPGNAVKALVWAQGESDRSSTIDVDYPPVFSAMVSQLRSDLSAPTLPVMLLGPMPDDTTSTQPLFIATQEKLDEASGDATAVPGVHYVARESGYISSDGTHPEPEGNRRIGRAAAQRFVALNTL